MPKSYNGHPSWNAWNVALWIGNDEGLYRAAVEAHGASRVRAVRVRHFRNATGLTEKSKTPDGAIYSNRSVGLAIAGIV